MARFGIPVLLMLFSAQAIAGDLTKLSVPQVCKLIRKGDSAALEEIVRRKVFAASEVANIASGTLFVGMTEGAAVCVTGPPERINTTHTSRGTRLQVILKDGRYLYIENGRVTAWTD